MADRLRREKDMLKKAVSSYLSTTTSSHYLKYFEGSPTYITYYQLDELASTHDVGLETVNSFLGNSSPKKYKKIKEVQVWGVDALSVANSLTERGLQSTIDGELLFLPNSVTPYAGDYFSFEYEGLESHLFKINDVQFDKASPTKFFRCEFSMSNFNHDEISGNVSNEYCVQYDKESGYNTGETKIVKCEDAAATQDLQDTVDKIIDRYVKLFYNEDLDTFLYEDKKEGYTYWCPYLQHFLHETKALSKYSQNILTEIYVMDINDVDNDNVYDEETYRESIYRKVEVCEGQISFDDNFVTTVNFDLKSTRNLPFFMNSMNFKLVAPISKESALPYANAISMYIGDSKLTFTDVPHSRKIHKNDAVHLARIKDYINVGDIVYECNNHELEPNNLLMVTNVDYIPTVRNVNLNKLDVDNLPSVMRNKELFKIIYDYLNNNLTVSESLVDTLKNYFYSNSLETYILTPMILHILKK